MPTSPFLDWNGNTFGITDESLWVNIRNTTSTAVPVTPTGDGVISAGNTTEVNLAGGATFEGTFENCLEYGAIRVAIYSSHASASRGLEFWCSKDGSNGFIDDSYTVPAATPKTYAVPVSAPYFKLRYTNGGTTTTTLKICCIFQRNVSVVSSHRLGDTVTDDDDAQLINAVLKAKLPNSTYANIDATAGGNLKVSIEEVDAGAFPFQTTITDGTDTAEIMTGPATGEKGLRVFVGPTDPISDLPVFIDFGQHQVHEGESYGWEYYSAAPATRNFAIVVPTYANTSRCPHLIMQMQSYGGAGMLSIYEGATYTGGVTATNVFNRNRNSTNTPAITIVDGVTSADGTKLPYTSIVGAAEKTSDSGRAQDEVILKSNTVYVVRYEEITATTRLVIHFEWYEDLGV